MHEQVAVPAVCEAFELVEVGDGLFDHPANRPVIFLRPRCGMIGSIHLERSHSRKAAES